MKPHKAPLVSIFTAAFVLLALLAPHAADATAKLKFKYPRKLDRLQVDFRAQPVSNVHPASEQVVFRISNLTGTLFQQAFAPGTFFANGNGSWFRYKVKPTGAAQIYSFAMKVDPVGGLLGRGEWRIKAKMDADLGQADPTRNTGTTVAELAPMTVQITIGDDPLADTSDWEFVGNTDGATVKRSRGWRLQEHFLFVTP